MITYRAAFWHVGGGVRAQVLDFPEARTQAPDLDAARRALTAVLLDMAERRLTRGESLPVPLPAPPETDADVQEPIELCVTLCPAGRGPLNHG